MGRVCLPVWSCTAAAKSSTEPLAQRFTWLKNLRFYILFVYVLAALAMPPSRQERVTRLANPRASVRREFLRGFGYAGRVPQLRALEPSTRGA